MSTKKANGEKLLKLYGIYGFERRTKNMATWIIDESYDDGYEHHKCSHCNTRALFDYIMEEDYDEGTDGEWEYLGMRDNGINEHITKFCPECGEKMDYEERNDNNDAYQRYTTI